VGNGVDAGRHHGDADDAFESLVEGCADDDVGFLVDLLADAGGGSSTSYSVRSLPPVDRDQQPRAPSSTRRRSAGLAWRLRPTQRALLARGFAGAHHRLPISRIRANVGEVEIDQAFLPIRSVMQGTTSRAPGRPIGRRRRRWSSHSPPGTGLFGMMIWVSTHFCSSRMPARRSASGAGPRSGTAW